MKDQINHQSPLVVRISREGDSVVDDATLLGGKAAGLVRMTQLGLNVPEAFVLTVPVHHLYRKNPADPAIKSAIKSGLQWLESYTGRKLGDPQKPLFVSVRSGAPLSMPGMMDTILNIGINPLTAKALINEGGSEEFVVAVYARFLKSFASSVLGLDESKVGLSLNGSETLESIIKQQATLRAAACGKGVAWPDDTMGELAVSVISVLSSWGSTRAKLYRKLHRISDDLGTAVTVQRMAFGNLDSMSCTGVAFSRDPVTGKREVVGEIIKKAQGEEIVGGTVTPEPMSAFVSFAPLIARELFDSCELLERKMREVQEIEFTVESGALLFLQTRTAKLGDRAAVRTLIDMVNEKLITRQEAVERFSRRKLKVTAEEVAEPTEENLLVATGIGSSSGLGSGVVVLSTDEALRVAASGGRPVLVLNETSPQQLTGINVSTAIITMKGGSTCHAAVVTRELGIPCVVGLGGKVDDKCMYLNDKVIYSGDTVSVDGSTGRIWLGTVKTKRQALWPELELLNKWAQQTDPRRPLNE